MPNVPSSALTLAMAILGWHREVGASLAHERIPGAARDRYFDTLHALGERDIGSRETQLAIAEAQLDGTFEYFFGEPVPAWLLPGSSIPEAAQTLGGLARLLRDALSEESPSHAPDGRRIVEFRSPAQLLREASSFYARFSAAQNEGIGGVELLLSCSLERSAQGGLVALLTPETLGFEAAHPGSRPDDLIDLLRSGSLIIEATGDTGIIEDEEEGSDGIPRTR